MVTAREEGRKLLSLAMDNSEAISDLFKYQAGQFRFNPIINIPSLGTGAVEANPCIAAGVNYILTIPSKFRRAAQSNP